MHKSNNVLWFIVGGVFLFIMGIWIYLKKPVWFSGTTPEAKYVNFEVASQSARPSIIKINCQGVSRYGVIIHPRGYVLTVDSNRSSVAARVGSPQVNNQQNVSSQDQGIYLTTYSGESFSGELVKTDKRNGFSIVKITADKEFVPVQTAFSGKISPGSLLFSPTEVQILISKVTKTEKRFIHMDIPANTSIDGAPMFNQNSELVGLYSVTPNILQKPDSQFQGPPVPLADGQVPVPDNRQPLTDNQSLLSGYVIPINRAKPLLIKVSELLPETIYTKQGLLKIKWFGGIFVPNTEITGTSLLVENPGDSSGIWQKSGIKTGDKITKINNNQINGFVDLERTIPAFANYKKVNFTVIKDGKEKNISVHIRKINSSRKFLFLPAVFVLAIFVLVYYLVYHNKFDFTILFVLGAVTVTICGYYLDFYDWADEWRAVTDEMQIIYFFLAMNILSIILEEGGLFNYLGHKIIVWSKGDRWKMMLGICLMTYFVALFVNTLTTIIVLLPLIFYITKKQPGLSPKPYIIGMVIASNLGGASTMVGGFTNILIATQNHIAFDEFIKYMMPICIIEFIVFLVYFRFSQKTLFATSPAYKQNPAEELPQLENYAGKDNSLTGEYDFAAVRPIRNPEIVKRGLIILGVLLIAIIISEFLYINPSIIAVIGGLAGLFFGGVKPGVIFEKLCYKDIFFFTGLFVLVGAAESSGLLTWFGEVVVHLSFGNVLVRCLLLMWMACFSTAFLDCGPSTVIFLHMIMNFKLAASDNMYFWALSLGVLAGSCATLTGATAGTVSANMLEDFLNTHKLPKIKTQWKHISTKLLETSGLSFKEYSQIGVPIALISLVISSIYMVVLYKFDIW